MDIITEVNRGIIFLRLNGVLDNNTLTKFNEEVDYLLYKQGVSFYTFDFSEVKINEESVFQIQNKLIEIFLNCGKVVMCGVNKLYQEKIGSGKNQLYYVNDQRDAFKLLSL